MGLGSRPVRGRRGRGRAWLRAGRGTDRGSVRPQAIDPETVQSFDFGDCGDGVDGTLHVENDLAYKTAVARPQKSQELDAEIVRYYDGAAQRI